MDKINTFNFNQISEDGSDIITLQANLALQAKSKFNLRPILAVQWGGKGPSYWAVAVVRKDSSVQSFADLRGKKYTFDYIN